MMRAMDKWFAGYLASVARRRSVSGVRHLFFCVADHFEPFGYGASPAAARAAVRHWVETYPAHFTHLRDADGHAPVHTFFYPAEEYDAACLDELACLCRAGFGEVEMQLHHRHDTPEGFTQKLTTFRDTLRNGHGLLGSDAAGALRFGFVHGNWALCNSRPDGDWCGVNEELAILRRAGCYADFTFPSAPSPTQPRTVNAIYRAHDHAGRPRGHDAGRPVVAGKPADAERDAHAVLMIQGPLALNWARRKWGVLPRLENGEISGANPATAARINLWAAQHIHVQGRPDWVFVKVHTHGCVEANTRVLLANAMESAHAHLQARYNDGRAWRLHYVSAREMANLVLAAEADEVGEPGAFRDYVVQPPPVRAMPLSRGRPRAAAGSRK